MTGNYKPLRIERNPIKGFSTIELAVVMLVILIIASVAIPQAMTVMHMVRLNGAVSDFAALLQVQRIRALDDDRFYSSYIVAANGANPELAFVDIFPQNANGTSGSGGLNRDPRDPLVSISQEVSPQPAAAAPNTANLRLQLLPANSPVAPQDGSALGTPVTWSPQGLPCTPTLAGGTFVCDSQGGATAYWVFFQNNLTQAWAAVTVSPAGRIRRWSFSAGTWNSF
jgi:type II secretory pathway pseudopilin PulG